MKIGWLGHSCFCIELDSGTRIITDPYQPGAFSGAVRYLPINLSADAVTISHHHADHDYVEGIPGAEVIDSEGEFKIKDVVIKGISSYHDSMAGSQRGKNTIFLIEAESLLLAHFGDLGTLDLDYSQLDNVDIAMVPVGGVFTIDHKEAATLVERISPKVVIPMHFKTTKLDFDIDGLDKFILGKNNVKRAKQVRVNKDKLPPSTEIFIIDHLR